MDKLVTDNYDYLLSTASNITRKIGSGTDLKYNLLHSVIEIIYNKIETHNTFLSDTDSFRKYLNKFMKQHFVWEYQRSKDDRLKNKDNELFTNRANFVDINCNANWDIEQSEYLDNILSDEKEHDLIILQAENVNDITKLYLKDLLVNDIPIERGLMYSSILNTIKELTPVEQELFNLHFVQELSVAQIYNQLKSKTDKRPIGYNTLRQMVKELRIKIIELIKNDN